VKHELRIADLEQISITQADGLCDTHAIGEGAIGAS
jgi:hypothetical protein